MGTGARTRRPGIAGSTTFALLGEVLLVGAVVLVLSIPLVTVVPALAAGARHLRRHLAGAPDPLSAMLREVGPALRDLWTVGVGLPALLLVTGYNLWLVGTGALPAGPVVGVVSAVVGAAALLVALRTAAVWVPGDAVGPALRAAALRTTRDPVGSVLLICAVGTCVVLVWMLLPLLLVVGGLLTFAALAVESRWAARK